MRVVGVVVGVALGSLVVLTACGGSSAPGTKPTASSAGATSAEATPGPGGEVRVFGGAGGGIAGQIVQIDGQRLTLSDPTGKRTTVILSQGTELRKTERAAASELQIGERVSVMGGPSADGRTVARVVEIAPPPTSSARQGMGPTEGTVESVSGESLRVRTATGSFVFLLTGETEYRRTVPAVATDLQMGQWVMAEGEPDAVGTVQPRSLTIVPPPTLKSADTGGPGRPHHPAQVPDSSGSG